MLGGWWEPEGRVRVRERHCFPRRPSRSDQPASHPPPPLRPPELEGMAKLSGLAAVVRDTTTGYDTTIDVWYAAEVPEGVTLIVVKTAAVQALFEAGLVVTDDPEKFFVLAAKSTTDTGEKVLNFDKHLDRAVSAACEVSGGLLTVRIRPQRKSVSGALVAKQHAHGSPFAVSPLLDVAMVCSLRPVCELSPMRCMVECSLHDGSLGRCLCAPVSV
jgi:hypothetical protein